MLKVGGKRSVATIAKENKKKGAASVSAVAAGAAGAQAAVVAGLSDGRVQMFGAASADDHKWQALAEGTVGAGAVVAAAVHPSGQFAVAASADGAWGLLDLATGRALFSAAAPAGAPAATCGTLHPDGVYFMLGDSSGAVRIYDVHSDAPPALTLTGKHEGPIRAVIASDDGCVSLSLHSPHTQRLCCYDAAVVRRKIVLVDKDI